MSDTTLATTATPDTAAGIPAAPVKPAPPVMI
jgi:hypothetical protein